MNRIAAYLSTQSAPLPAPSFVLCPLPLFAAHSAQVAEVYRVAAERTREQLAAWRSPGVPAFSAN